MSVIIKGMDMPMCCGRCDFSVSSLYCNRTGSKIDRDYEYRERLSDCPISELPEKHGRLIDAADLIATVDDRFCIGEIGRRKRAVIADALYYAPTIVEAEGDN